MQFRAACRRLRIRHVSSSRAEEEERKRKRERGGVKQGSGECILLPRPSGNASAVVCTSCTNK